MASQETALENYDVEFKDGKRQGDVVYHSNVARTFPITVEGDQIARVRVNGGITKNLGNYESLRCDVTLELPCASTQAGVEAAFEYAKDWIAEKVTELTQTATEYGRS